MYNSYQAWSKQYIGYFVKLPLCHSEIYVRLGLKNLALPINCRTIGNLSPLGFLSFLHLIYFYSMFMDVCLICMCTMPDAYRDQKRV